MVFDDDPDEDEEPTPILHKILKRLSQLEQKEKKTTLRIGDVAIESQNNLNESKKIIEEILKSKPIKNYLEIHRRKKLFNNVTYTE